MRRASIPRGARISLAQNSAIRRVPSPVTLGIAINLLHSATITGSGVSMEILTSGRFGYLDAPVHNCERVREFIRIQTTRRQEEPDTVDLVAAIVERQPLIETSPDKRPRVVK